MDKNSVIGFILIAAILFGFTAIQSRKAREYNEYLAEYNLEQAALKAAADSLAAAADTLPASAPAVPAAPQISRDSLLNSRALTEADVVTLENSKIRLTLSTKGAQPVSVLVKDYFNHDSTDLYLFRQDAAYRYNQRVVLRGVGDIDTENFVFDVALATDSTVLMRLPVAGGAIEQKYTLLPDSYRVDAALVFVGLDDILPKDKSMLFDFNVNVPRMEKGYKNESQYSKLDYYYDGEKNPDDIRKDSKNVAGGLSWFAYQQQFFSTIVTAPRTFQKGGSLGVNFYKEGDANLMACKSHLAVSIDDDRTFPLEFYFGPNHYQPLKSYDRAYEKIIPLGGWLVGWFTKYAIIPMFNLFHRFIDSFGLIILLMTLVIKLVVFPLTYKSYASSAKMSALKPELDKLNAKYPKQEDAMKKQQAQMALYKKAGVSPMGGCLPTLLTFPILWAMFRFFPASIELRQQSFLWCHDLSAYDSIIDYGTRVPIFGDHLSLFALLMAVTMWLYSKMNMANNPTAGDPTAKSMNFMTLWMMPIMMFFICNSLSAALSYYYLLSQLIAMLQTWFIRKFMIHPEEILAKARAADVKPSKKSKWQLRLEQAQKMQEQQLREQQKKRR